jgi:hypothetical protein
MPKDIFPHDAACKASLENCLPWFSKKEPEFQQAHFRILPGTALQTAIILFFETSMVMLGQANPKA